MVGIKQQYERIRPTLKWWLPALTFLGIIITITANGSSLYRAHFAKPIVHDPVLAVADEKGVVTSFQDRWSALEPFDATLLLRLAEAARVQSIEPNSKIIFPAVNPWDFGYAVDYYAQGDEDEAVVRTVWRSCVTPGPKLSICLRSPEYRRTHHLHRRDWRG